MATPPASSCVYLLGGVLDESRRVVSSHSRHFLAISVLFLLPLSLLLLSSPSLLLAAAASSSPSHPQSLLRSTPAPSASSSIGIATAAAASIVLSLSAAAAVAHSVHRSLFSRPVNLFPTLKTLPFSLLRLLLTLLASLLSISLLSLLLYSLSLLLSPVLLPFLLLAAALSALHLALSFSLAFPVAVLESTSGFSPLRRSQDLLRGMRGPAACLLLSSALPVPLMVWIFGLTRPGPATGWKEAAPAVARTVLGAAAMVLLLLYYFVTNTVLYVYCKAVRGELAEEVAREYEWEYVCLPSDPDKVPHVVSVVRQ